MKYRKKPVIIEAFEWNAEQGKEKPNWFIDAIHSGKVYYQGGEPGYYTIETLEGNMTANAGDYIIQGIKGEIYPCKPDIFLATYDKVE